MRGFVSAVVMIGLLSTGPAAAAQERTPDRKFEWMLGGYVALQATDMYLTHRGTREGLEEANPLFASGRSVMTARRWWRR